MSESPTNIIANIDVVATESNNQSEDHLPEPLTVQEKREQLTPEMLAKLSTDEYLALWKKLNPYFLTHVTRQGFRDHFFTSSHAVGLSEYQSGLTKIMEDDKKLRTPYAVAGLKETDEVSLKIFLSKDVLKADTEELAHQEWNDFLHHQWGTAPKYPDKSSIHFAAQEVANKLYGGESGNEVVICYPSDVLASQYNFAFGSGLKDFTQPNSDITWNDVWIYPKTQQDPGISVDAGIVFLPEKVQVDPNTGSRYASEVQIIDGKATRVMVEDKELVASFDSWWQQLTSESPVVKAATEYGRERGYVEKRNLEKIVQDICQHELGALGFTGEQINDLEQKLIDRLSMWETQESIDPTGESRFKIYEPIIRESFGRFKRPQETIEAKAYWEKFFEEHPDLKPAHIAYYNDDPTEAIRMFLDDKGVGVVDTSKTEGHLLGFDDHHVVDVANDPRSNEGHQELVELGNRIIKEHYSTSLETP